ncbi:MAG: ATP-dependent nuclease [Treponemataceae bacterium]
MNKPTAHITKIVFNNNEHLDIAKNDIIVFVGPNNAGKSQALNDIYNLSDYKQDSIIIDDITITKNNIENIKNYFSKTAMITKSDYEEFDHYSGFNFAISNSELNNYEKQQYLNRLQKYFIAHLPTDTRLSIASAPECINRNEIKTHPIHYPAFNQEISQKLSANFKKAFGTDLIPNNSFGRTIPLCMGQDLKVSPDDSTSSYSEIINKQAETLAKYKQVDKQGDGIRSFTGILLYLIIDTYCTFIIDEPESFLHPPQAYIMGRMIGEILSQEQQCFLSTHSKEIIRGLIDVCSDRVKIIRITREEDNNVFSILQNEGICNIWEDPLLKHSEIMNSLFHKNTVVCESDSDCKMYSLIDSAMKNDIDKYSEAFFIHCGGKHRLYKVATALKSIGIDFKVIPDIDILNDENIIKKLVTSCYGDWSSIEKDFKVFSRSLTANKDKISISDLKRKFDELPDNISKKQLIDLIKEVTPKTKWDILKEGGTNIIPAGDSRNAFDNIDEYLRKLGIFIVPVGEIENFVKQVGGHGSEWVNGVLENYANLNDDIFESIKKFVKSWNI